MALVAATVASPALAGNIKILPQPTVGQTIRYDKGIPTIEDDMQNSAIRVVPMPDLDHGSLSFQVAVLNKGNAAINLGVENLTFSQGATQLAVFTKDEVEKKAKNRAMWSQIGYAALAGAAAGLQNNNTYINTYGRHGGDHIVIHNSGLSDGQVAAVAAGGGAIALSEIRLQQTIDGLNDQYLQTSTVDPNGTYGGRIICAKLKNPQASEQVSLDVNINGEHHLFTFTVSAS